MDGVFIQSTKCILVSGCTVHTVYTHLRYVCEHDTESNRLRLESKQRIGTASEDMQSKFTKYLKTFQYARVMCYIFLSSIENDSAKLEGTLCVIMQIESSIYSTLKRNAPHANWFICDDAMFRHQTTEHILYLGLSTFTFHAPRIRKQFSY